MNQDVQIFCDFEVISSAQASIIIWPKPGVIKKGVAGDACKQGKDLVLTLGAETFRFPDFFTASHDCADHQDHREIYAVDPRAEGMATFAWSYSGC